MRDNRNTVVIVILTLCIIVMMLTIVASASYELGLSARASALYEPVTGTFIYANNADARLPMASTTKIMTGLLAIELCDLDEAVKVPAEAVGTEGSSVYLSEGDVISVRDLLYSLLLQSANDAAVVLAMKISGDIPGFAALMNEKASLLGLTDTHFDNPHGLDSETHYTTAHDLAIIASAALKNDTFREIVSTYKHTFSLSGKPRTVVNHNKLLRSYSGAIGVKTGYTRSCGRCLVSAAERNGLMLIAVTLDAPNDWRDHTSMLDYGFERYEAVSVRSLTRTQFTLPVIGSDTKEIKAVLSDADKIRLVRKIGDGDFEAHVDIKPYVCAPAEAGDAVGEVIFTKDGTEVARADITLISGATETRKKKFNIFDIF